MTENTREAQLTRAQRREVRRARKREQREREVEKRADREAMERFREWSPVCDEVGHDWTDHSSFSGGGASTCSRCGVTDYYQLGRHRFHVNGTTVYEGLAHG